MSARIAALRPTPHPSDPAARRPCRLVCLLVSESPRLASDPLFGGVLGRDDSQIDSRRQQRRASECAHPSPRCDRGCHARSLRHCRLLPPWLSARAACFSSHPSVFRASQHHERGRGADRQGASDLHLLGRRHDPRRHRRAQAQLRWLSSTRSPRAPHHPVAVGTILVGIHALKFNSDGYRRPARLGRHVALSYHVRHRSVKSAERAARERRERAGFVCRTNVWPRCTGARRVTLQYLWHSLHARMLCIVSDCMRYDQ